MRTLEPLPNAEREPALGRSSLATGAAGVQWQIAGRGLRPVRASTCARGSAAASCGSGTTRRNRSPPDAPPRHALPGRRAQHRASCTRASAAGRTRSASQPDETVTVQPWFAPYNGRYVFHCHSAGARRQGDDAAAGGGGMRRALLLGAGLALVAAAPAGAQRTITVRRARQPGLRQSPDDQGDRSVIAVIWSFEPATVQRTTSRGDERQLGGLRQSRSSARRHASGVHVHRRGDLHVRLRVPSRPR